MQAIVAPRCADYASALPGRTAMPLRDHRSRLSHVLCPLLLVLLAACAPAPRNARNAADRQPASSDHCVPPLNSERLFLRGAMTTWALREDLAFTYVCDAYLLNVDLHGTYDFRITDARFSGGVNFGARDGATLALD